MPDTDFGGVKVGRRGGKKSNFSPLMEAITSSSDGEIVNACPFGCETEDLDEKGLCDHLVGYTLPGDKTRFEVLEPAVPASLGVRPLPRRVNGQRIEKVRAGDKLLRITVSSRVYREKAKAEPK